MKREIETDSKVMTEITNIKKQFSGGDGEIDDIIGEMMRNNGGHQGQGKRPGVDPRALFTQMYTLGAEAKIKGVCDFLELFLDYD